MSVIYLRDIPSSITTSAHLRRLATFAGLGTISCSSGIVRFVQGGVVKSFRCAAQMQINVRVVRQSSGPGYVVKYCADFDTNDSMAVNVTVSNTIPADADQELIAIAQKSIANGFSTILADRGLGANVVVRDLVIHDVDFSEFAFKRFTMQSLRECLGESSA